MRSRLLQTSEAGYTLIEVLVAVVVLSIGLLGMANMQLITLRNNNESYLRSQAAIIATDLADRIHGNIGEATRGGYLLVAATAPTYPGFDCVTSACSSAALAQADVYQWYTQAAARLPGFKASVSCTPVSADPAVPCQDLAAHTSVQNITVMWDEPDEYHGTGTNCSNDHDVDLYCYRLSINP